MRRRPLDPEQTRGAVGLAVYDFVLFTRVRREAIRSRVGLSYIVELALRDWVAKEKLPELTKAETKELQRLEKLSFKERGLELRDPVAEALDKKIKSMIDELTRQKIHKAHTQ